MLLNLLQLPPPHPPHPPSLPLNPSLPPSPRCSASQFPLLLFLSSLPSFLPSPLSDPFLIVLFLPQLQPPLFHPSSVRPSVRPPVRPSAPLSFSPGRTFTLSESEQNGTGRRTHLGAAVVEQHSGEEKQTKQRCTAGRAGNGHWATPATA